MTTATSSSPLLGAAGALRRVRDLVAGVSRWLEERQRAYDDANALAQLSDRDLHDIGLDRGFVSAVARGRWTRDAPDA